MRLTVAQALVTFLARQYTERDGERHRLFAGCFGIFGHGNVAGIGQALYEAQRTGSADLRYYQSRNEQAMVHAAAGYARATRRMSTFACTTSVGPGATNMVTGAAGATINRLPVLLLPGDVFATRPADPVLQQLEQPWAGDMSVNDCLRPVSRYFDRITRPERLFEAALAAVRTLTDPADTGAVTLALPQDVQAEAYDWPGEFLAERAWPVRRPVPEPGPLAEAVRMVRAARRPMIVAGGGIAYSDAAATLAALCDATGIPVGETQAGKGALRFDHPAALGAVGATGTTAANAVAAEADLVIGVGTRYSDFTTASNTVFANPDVRYVSVNVAPVDAARRAGLALVADAREALAALRDGLAGWRVDAGYTGRIGTLRGAWSETVDRAYAPGHGPLPAQSEVIGAVNAAARDHDTVVCAAGSMPGDLHRMWRPGSDRQYHVEYGYSCMGYEIAGGLGVRLATDPGNEVFVLVGDGSYLMMAQELVTAVAEGAKLTVVLVDNRGYSSIGALSETVGAPRFGTWYRYRDEKTGRLDGADLPTDLAANAASLGADVVRVDTVAELTAALAAARTSTASTVIRIATDPLAPAPDAGAWWDVPVAEVSALQETRDARAGYDEARRAQRRPL